MAHGYHISHVLHTAAVVVVPTLINLHYQVRGHRTGSSHSGAEEYPLGKTQSTQGGTRIDYITQCLVLFSAGTFTKRSPALNRAPGTIANSAKTALLRAGQCLINAGTGTTNNEIVFELFWCSVAPTIAGLTENDMDRYYC